MVSLFTNSKSVSIESLKSLKEVLFFITSRKAGQHCCRLNNNNNKRRHLTFLVKNLYSFVVLTLMLKFFENLEIFLNFFCYNF